jgi:hypothetical protein
MIDSDVDHVSDSEPGLIVRSLKGKSVQADDESEFEMDRNGSGSEENSAESGNDSAAVDLSDIERQLSGRKKKAPVKKAPAKKAATKPAPKVSHQVKGGWGAVYSDSDDSDVEPVKKSKPAAKKKAVAAKGKGKAKQIASEPEDDESALSAVESVNSGSDQDDADVPLDKAGKKKPQKVKRSGEFQAGCWDFRLHAFQLPSERPAGA